MTKAQMSAPIPVHALISVLLLTICFTSLLQAQDDYRITVNAAMVSTDVTIIGTPASSLRPEDFIVYDNEVQQPISHFSRDQIPLAIAIVVDRSLTVQPYMPMLQMAAISSLRRLKPEDQVALFAFDYNVQKLADLTEDRSLIAEKIGKIQNQLGTNIYDAICDSAHYLKKKAPQYRRALILISDNILYGNKRPKEARQELLEAATALYNIKTPPIFGFGIEGEKNKRSLAETDAEIKRMIEETGGQAFDMKSGISIQSALDKVINDLRTQYTIGFNPSNPGASGSFHRLAVKLAVPERCPGCQLLTRSGYLSGVSAPLPSARSNPKPLQAGEQKPEKSLIERNMLIAANSSLELKDIPFTVKVGEQQDSKEQPQIKVDLQIDFRRVEFKHNGNTHDCKLRIAAFYVDSKGKLLGSDWRVLEGQLKDETYNQALQAGVSFSLTVPLKESKQIIKVVVYDELSDKAGSHLLRLP